MKLSNSVLSSFMLVALLNVSACSNTTSNAAPLSQTASFENAVSLLNDDTTAAAPEAAQLGAATNDSVQYMRIKHHMVECEGFQVSHCMLTQLEGSDEWTYFYDQIEGLEYQWGSEYEVLVQVVDVATGMADASNRRYELLEVLSETAGAAVQTFNYTTRNASQRIVDLGGMKFSLLGNKEFTCTADSCESLRSVIAQDQSAVLSFEHGATPADAMVLSAVLCSDAAASFNGSCK